MYTGGATSCTYKEDDNERNAGFTKSKNSKVKAGLRKQRQAGVPNPNKGRQGDTPIHKEELWK